MTLSPGLRGTARRIVTEDLTAERLGSGDVPVLGTPAVLALVEEAAVAAVAGALEQGQTSVGTWAELEHTAPSAIGATVEAEAELLAAEGRRLEFRVTAREGDRTIARGRHRRTIVDRERFLASLR